MPSGMEFIKYKDFVNGLPAAAESDLTAANNAVINDPSVGPKKLPGNAIAKGSTQSSSENKDFSFSVVHNKRVRQDGITANIDYGYLDYIQVNLGDVIECSPGIACDCAIRLYNSSKSSVDYFSFANNAVRTFTVYTGVKYILMPFKYSDYKNAYIKINDVLVFSGNVNGTLKDSMSQKYTCGANLYFEGAGTSFSYMDHVNAFAPGKRYRIEIMNPDFSASSGDASDFKLLMRAFDSSNNIIDSKNIIGVTINQTVAKSYDVVIPSGTAYVRFGGRTTAGSSVVARVVELENESERIENGKNYSRMCIPTSVINSTASAGYPTYDDSTLRVCCEDVVIFPVVKAKYKVHTPDNIQISAAVLNASGSYAGAIDWKSDGDVFLFDCDRYGNYAFRWSFRRPNRNITAQEVGDMLKSGEISVEVLDVYDVDYSASPQICRATSAIKKLVVGSPYMKALPAFVHVSDLHGDITRLRNARKIAELVNADALVNSGDSVMYQGKQGCKFVAQFGGDDIPEIFCIGNHEAYPTGDTQLFSKFISPLVSGNGYEKVSGTPADDCYYFVDIAAKKVRVIAINYYNGGVYAGSLGQAQLEWFVATLLSTPQDYGVVVVLHSPEDKVVCPEELSKFRQAERVTTYQENGFYVGDRPIRNIIDGFISKTSGTETYTENEVEVSVSYDFAAVNTGVEFICYMAGHRHEDWVGYYNGSTNMQLCLGITVGNAINSMFTNTAWANQSDLGRNNGKGAPQDAVNVYAIDRDAGVIKLCRIGADVTTSFELRDMLKIPYRSA